MQPVIVIGSGAAGISAAYKLVERGFQVNVYGRNSKYGGGKARNVDAPGTNKWTPKPPSSSAQCANA